MATGIFPPAVGDGQTFSMNRHFAGWGPGGIPNFQNRTADEADSRKTVGGPPSASTANNPEDRKNATRRPSGE